MGYHNIAHLDAPSTLLKTLNTLHDLRGHIPLFEGTWRVLVEGLL